MLNTFPNEIVTEEIIGVISFRSEIPAVDELLSKVKELERNARTALQAHSRLNSLFEADNSELEEYASEIRVLSALIALRLNEMFEMLFGDTDTSQLVFDETSTLGKMKSAAEMFAAVAASLDIEQNETDARYAIKYGLVNPSSSEPTP